MTSLEIDEYMKLNDRWNAKFGENIEGFGFGLTADAFPSIEESLRIGDSKPFQAWWEATLDELGDVDL